MCMVNSFTEDWSKEIERRNQDMSDIARLPATKKKSLFHAPISHLIQLIGCESGVYTIDISSITCLSS